MRLLNHETLTKRCKIAIAFGLLHDLGKAVDEEDLEVAEGEELGIEDGVPPDDADVELAQPSMQDRAN